MHVFETPIGRYAPGIVNVVIEIAKGSRKRYRYHRKRNAFVVDYRLMTPTPAEYGWIPETWTKGGKRVNALVLVRKPTWAGNTCEVRPIGALKRRDGDHQIIGVLLGEPRFEEIRDVGDLDGPTLKRLVQFFEPFFPIEGWMSREEAMQLLVEANENYKRRSPKERAQIAEAESEPTEEDELDEPIEDEEDEPAEGAAPEEIEPTTTPSEAAAGTDLLDEATEEPPHEETETDDA